MKCRHGRVVLRKTKILSSWHDVKTEYDEIVCDDCHKTLVDFNLLRKVKELLKESEAQS